jgi:hypothetical protein
MAVDSTQANDKSKKGVGVNIQKSIWNYVFSLKCFGKCFLLSVEEAILHRIFELELLVNPVGMVIIHPVH